MFVDDFGFVDAMIERINNDYIYGVDTSRVYATGFSNGADISLALACVRSEKIAAVASVSGLLDRHTAENSNPSAVAIMSIHGTNDYINIYNGDPNGSGGWGAYPSIPETIEYWSNLNNCSSFSSENIENSNTSDGSYVVKERNYDCQDENEIWLYKVVGGDHDWPGAWGNFDINSSLEAWLFFEQTIGSLSIDNGLINELKMF